jgi:hypothetical protein
LDPIMELRDGNVGLIRESDNWRTGGQEADIIVSTVPRTNDFESAIVATPSANGATYTAIVRGVSERPASPWWKFTRCNSLIAPAAQWRQA